MRFTILAVTLLGVATPLRRFQAALVQPDCSPYPRDGAPLCLASIRGGDLVKPSFSPSGRFLAFASVTVRPASEAETDEFSELDGTMVADLKTNSIKVLLEPEQARKYASYSAFVDRIQWRSDDLLLVTYADGDVECDQMTIRRTDSKFLATQHGSAEDQLPVSTAGGAQKELTAAETRQLLPGLPAELSVESGQLNNQQNLLAIVAGKEPHRQLLIFRLHPPKKP